MTGAQVFTGVADEVDVITVESVDDVITCAVLELIDVEAEIL